MRRLSFVNIRRRILGARAPKADHGVAVASEASAGLREAAFEVKLRNFDVGEAFV